MFQHHQKSHVGLVVPSTNTVVEEEFAWMVPPQVSLHSARLHVTNPAIATDDDLSALVDAAIAAVPEAIASLLTMRPDHLVIGMSVETIWGGVVGARAFRALLDSTTDLTVTTPADACVAALQAVGSQRLGLITPYADVGNAQLTTYLEESGFVVGPIRGPAPEVATDISQASAESLVPLLDDLAGEGVDTILQFCTNLPFARLADEATRWLGLPVIAINAATCWHALRQAGIADRRRGCGPLLEHH